jgi:hypothetical protein
MGFFSAEGEAVIEDFAYHIDNQPEAQASGRC